MLVVFKASSLSRSVKVAFALLIERVYPPPRGYTIVRLQVLLQLPQDASLGRTTRAVFIKVAILIFISNNKQ